MKCPDRRGMSRYTIFVNRRCGTEAAMATTQHRADTTTALVRSDKAKTDIFIGLQITRYLSRENAKIVSTFAQEALTGTHQVNQYQQESPYLPL